MKRSHRSVFASLLAVSMALTAYACEDATTVNLLEIDAVGAVFGSAYLDNNGNGELDIGDNPLKNIGVVLTVAGGGQVVDEAETDSTGLFVIFDIPVGSYRLDLNASQLGDSLSASDGGTELTIERGDTTRVNFGASFPVLTLDEVRAATPGQRVFTSGIALNARQAFGDGLVHFQLDSSYLRATNVARASINVGDSIRLLGRVKVDQGQTIIDDVTPFPLITSATVPIPVELGSAEAQTARGGALDAAFVIVRNAEIYDTTTEAGLFRFRVDDGTGKVDVVFRPFLQLNNEAMRPDTILRIKALRGLLVPILDGAGAPRWRIYPRASSDVIMELKQADLGFKASVNPSAGIKGDTLRFTVVVTNAGPLGASGVQITDSVPEVLKLLSATTTSGDYDSETGIWSMDSLRVGDTDTLRFVTQIDTDLLGQRVNVASLTKILREVDPNPTNNGASSVFTIEQKLSDLGLEMTLDTTEVSKGDTLGVTLVLSNEGPRGALGVQVTDSLPFGLTFIDATPTRGTYDSKSGIWDVGSLAVNASDTLRFRGEITTDLLGQNLNRARITRIQEGLDPDPSNNLVTIFFTVQVRPEDPAGVAKRR